METNAEIKPEEFKSEEVDLEKVKPMESQSIDLSKYDKNETTIADVKVTKVKSQYSETGFQWVLRVSSEILETLKSEDGDIDFRASELFNLIQNDEGVLTGFPTGESSNLMKFLRDLGIKNPENLKNLMEVKESIIGKKVLIKSYEKEHQGNTRTYLKFRY